MEKWKKVFLVGLALVFSLMFLTACNGDEPDAPDEPEVEDVEETPDEPEEETPDEPEEDEEAATGGESFLLWIDQTPYAEALIAALSDRFPDINFEFEEVGSTYTVERLSLDGPAGTGADIILFPHDNISDAINQNSLLPLGPDIAAQMQGRVPEPALDAVRIDGEYFAIPMRMNSIGFFYNRDLLDEHGFDVAESFEEIVEQAAEFNDDYILRWEAGNAFFSYFFLTSFGYELFGPQHNDPEAINFNTPAVIEGLAYYQTIRDILPVSYGDLDWDATHGAFVAGEVPYLISGPWSISEAREGGFEWGITRIPTVDGNRPITFSDINVAAASAYTENPPLAREVLEFMMSDEGLQILYDYVGAIPALIDTSVIDGLADDPFLTGIVAQAEYSHPMPIIPEMGSFWGPAETMFRSVWEGLATPEEAAENAETEYEAARALID